jgi:hypothetical protein
MGISIVPVGVVLLAWGLQIAVVIYVIRALATIVAGLRAINAQSERIAVAVEKLANEREGV